MAFHTPHGSARFRLPWSWSSFDYRDALPGAVGADRRALRDPQGRGAASGDDVVHTDRGDLTAPLIVDALGWRRVLGPGANVQPPEAAISRGLEVHPHGVGTDLDVWIDRSLIRRGYAWSVPADGEQRIGVGSYEPRDHVKEPTKDDHRSASTRDAVRYQGNWFPHRLRPAPPRTASSSSATAPGHCLPLSGEGIRTAFYFGIQAGRELRAALDGRQTREQALRNYARFSSGTPPRSRPRSRSSTRCRACRRAC